MKKKVTTKQRQENQVKIERANTPFVAIKDFCETHKVSLRIFKTELSRQGVEFVDFKGETTGNQKAHGIRKETAEDVLKQLRKSFSIRDDEITLSDLADKCGITVNALHKRLELRGIEGRTVRYHDEENPHLHHQPTTAYKVEDVADLRKDAKLRPVEKGEVTSHDICERLGVSKRALYARIKVRGIKGRKSRYPADAGTRSNQPTIVYREEDIAVLSQDFRSKEAKEEQQ